MKRNLLLVILALFIIIMSMSGCGSSKVNVAEVFSERVKTISQENGELSRYSMGNLMNQGNGVYSSNVTVDGKTIGAISVTVKNEQIAEFTFSFSASGPSQSEYQQPIIATAMAMDSALDYIAAEEISDELNLMLVFGDGSASIENNGYTYSAVWKDDGLVYIKISK